jgi:hypothetical protein
MVQDRPAREPFKPSSSLWFGVALVTLVGAVVAIFRLVLLYPPEGIALAAVLGAATYYAVDQGWALRAEELRRGPSKRPLRGRAKEIALAPSFEVYDPRRAEPSEPGGSPPPVE